MGQAVSGLWRQLFGSGDYKIVMVRGWRVQGGGTYLGWRALQVRATPPLTQFHPAPLQVGLDNAGKTTTLYHLHMGETVKTQPTIGSNVSVWAAHTHCCGLVHGVWREGASAVHLRSRACLSPAEDAKCSLNAQWTPLLSFPSVLQVEQVKVDALNFEVGGETVDELAAPDCA